MPVDSRTIGIRKPENNFWGALNTREEFAKAHTDIDCRLLKAYEKACAEASGS